MDRVKLRRELVDDPLVRGYTSMNNAAKAADVNSVYRTRVIPLDSRALLLWGASNQRWKNLSDGQTHGNPDVANLCITAMSFLEREASELDMANPVHIGFVDALVGASPAVLDSADKAALIAMATEDISRATQLGLGPVTEGDVERALA